MDTVNSLEKTVAEWYKNVPHLPANARKWLGENVWWLTLIGVVLSVLGLLAIIPLALLAFGLSAAVSTSTMYTGYETTGFYWLGALLGLASLVVTTILMIMAINPLKAKAKRGWSLLFATLLVSLLFNVIGDLVSLSLIGLFFAVLWSAVGAYFLFEIRSQFGAKTVKPAAKTAKK